MKSPGYKPRPVPLLPAVTTRMSISALWRERADFNLCLSSIRSNNGRKQYETSSMRPARHVPGSRWLPFPMRAVPGLLLPAESGPSSLQTHSENVLFHRKLRDRARLRLAAKQFLFRVLVTRFCGWCFIEGSLNRKREPSVTHHSSLSNPMG